MTDIKQFELKKLKVDASGKTEVAYRRMITKGGQSYADDVIVESPRVPHPDMTQALAAMVPLLAEANSLYVHRNEQIPPKLRPQLVGKDIERILGIWDKQVNDAVEVSGITLQGDLETGSCIITGKHKVHNTAVAMNSPKISFNGDTFGIETEVQTRVQTIVQEVFDYLFNNKAAQQMMEFPEEEGGKTEEVVEETVEA